MYPSPDFRRNSGCGTGASAGNNQHDWLSRKRGRRPSPTDRNSADTSSGFCHIQSNGDAGKRYADCLENPAQINILGRDTAEILFDEPQRAITPGQSAVFYRNDTLIGGGIITKLKPASI